MQTVFPAFPLLPLENLIDYAPLTVGAEATIWDAIALMNQYQPPAQRVLVVENWRTVGLFSWEDVLEVVKSEVNLRSSKITEVMTTSVIKFKYSQLQDTELILPLLTQLKKPIIIEDEQKQLVGYIAPETISSLLLKEYQLKITDAERLSNKNQQIISSTGKDKNEDLETLFYFRQAIESSSEGIIITDIIGNAIYVNSSFIKIFKYTSEELNALGGLSFLWKDTAEYQQLLATIEEGNSWRNELEIKNCKDDILHINVRIDAIKDVMGKVIGMIGIHTNITQEVKTQEALRLKNRAFNASNNGIMIFDVRLASKPIVYVNPEFERICDDSISQPLGFKNSFVENINHEINKLLKSRYYSSSKRCNLILRNYCKDGKELWCQFSVSPVFNVNKKITHYICIQTDITKHKQIEMSFLITQEKLQHLLFSTTGVIYSSECYEDYGVTFISDNIIDMTGYQTEDILCDSNFWVSHIHPEDIQFFMAELPKVFTQNKVNIEYRFLHKNGNYIWIYEESKLVKDNSDNPLEIIGYRIDITERKQLEEDLQEALEKEKELNELKSRFISMTSHEFRTPLSTILSSSELLENYRHKWEEEKQLKHFDRIKKAVKHMTNLLNDVLFFGKAEAGKLDCSPGKLDLVEYSRQLVEDVQINQTKNAMGQPDVNISFMSNKTTLIGEIDEKTLGHILNNLLSNAIKYSKPGTSVNFTISSQEKRTVFEIQDEGIGIPSEDLPSLFDSFHRCNNVGNIQGTGLGLSIVKKCVDMLKGEISVTSEVGVGTKFTITIPLTNCCNNS